MRHILLISGKDSLATAIVQTRRAPDLPYELVHNETGWDLPETLEWIERVGDYFDRPIIKCGDDLTQICIEENCLPLAGFRRFCTRLAKIKPLNDYLGKLPPAFHWQWIEDRVRELLGRDQWLLDRLPEWDRRALLAWRSRSNCDRCFYARLYEKIGLYEHRPDRFEDSCVLEERLCHRQEHTWAKGYRLRDLIPRAAEIKERRAKSIVKYLRTKQVRSLFDDEEQPDELLVTSCGLYCGK